MFLGELDDLRHSGGIRLGIGGKPFDRDLIQTVFLAKVAESLVSNDQILIFQLTRHFAELAVQLISLCRIFTVVRLVGFLIGGVGLHERIFDVLHLFLCVQRAEPYVRVGGGFLLFGAFAGRTFLVLMLARSLKQRNPGRSLYRNKLVILQGVQHAVRPMLHSRTVINKNICIFQSDNVVWLGLPVVRLRPRGNQICHCHFISADFFGEILHGVKAGVDRKLLAFFRTGCAFNRRAYRARTAGTTSQQRGAKRCAYEPQHPFFHEVPPAEINRK